MEWIANQNKYFLFDKLNKAHHLINTEQKIHIVFNTFDNLSIKSPGQLVTCEKLV